VDLALGAAHSCALAVDGTVWCWGDNDYGQLGDGSTAPSFEPVPVLGLPPATRLALGYDHSCAIDGQGGLYCWGRNGAGQLGIGSMDASLVPAPVPLSGVVDVAAGEAHTCAVVATGEVLCWGANTSGQLGVGSTSGSSVPVSVGALGASTVALGGFHSCAGGPGGALCWGGNSDAQVGPGPNAITSPTLVPLPLYTQALSLSSKGYFTCASYLEGALEGTPHVACWGDDDSGQLGQGSTSPNGPPSLVLGLEGPFDELGETVSLAAGVAHACARTPAGEAYCWGSNYSGQLGDGSGESAWSPVPVGLGGVDRLASGTLHSCALLYGGELVCWGGNDFGQLGDGTNVARPTPTPVAW
jgi:alpha-tubulin suppressor-like RCC1 family protein